VTIVGATHNDAQYPSITSTQWGIDPFTDRDKQEQFLAAMVASAFSLLHQPPFKIAWNHFKPQAENGRIKFAKIRLEKNLDISGDLGPAAGRNTDHRERMDKNLSSSL
jgi:hypothetical protein